MASERLLSLVEKATNSLAFMAAAHWMAIYPKPPMPTTPTGLSVNPEGGGVQVVNPAQNREATITCWQEL